MDILNLKRLIEDTLKMLGEKYYSQEAVSLLMRTAFVESKLKYLYQFSDGPARGFFQIEPSTAKSIYDNYLLYRHDLLSHINSIVGVNWHKNIEHKLTSDISLSIIIARLKYYQDSEPIPKDLEGQAHYWKRIYNTEYGKGTVENFINECRRLEIQNGR